ncbi:hypothetical protein D9756_010554 [Leucocoprinus leucothites]|uniref:BTB domain-containing protein n=1 Tax=Leucocoprinus leucothites TaxID=201217 RepID=A0A8H5CS25_9AGAR|nr:hypothetical protein D9756_010554 [Leucoagaricus leucothites]
MSRPPVAINFPVSQQTFHPKFNDETADTILSSNQGTLFRMHSVTLKTASGLLRLFLSQNEPSRTLTDTLPPSSNDPRLGSSGSDSPTDVISLPFNDAPIERVLFILSAQPTEPWVSFEELEAAVDVMDYLDTPGPLAFVRASCFMPVFALEPVRLYGLGAKFGWGEVITYAARLTLTFNLFPSSDDDNKNKIEEQLTRLPSSALYRLLKFHRRRRDTFRESVYSMETFGVGNAVHINCPCGTEVNNSFWRELRSRLVWEIDQNPSGETILAPEVMEMEESKRCWKAKCTGCGSLYYNMAETLKNIRGCVELLPKDP